MCVLIETAGEFHGDPLTLGDSVVEEYLDRLEQLPLYQALVQGGLEGAGLTGRGRAGERDDVSWTVPEEWLHDDYLGDIRPTVYRSTPSGDVWRIVSPEGGVKDDRHNEYHQVTTSINSAGATTEYIYNDDGVIIEKELPNGRRARIETGDWATPIRSIDANGSVTEFSVDVFGLVQSVTSPTGAVTEYRYDVRSSGVVPQATIHPDGTVTEIECDDAGRTHAVIDPAGRRSTMLRDVRGLIVETIDPVGAVTSIDYTPEGWPSKITQPDGTSVSAEYDGEGNRVVHTNEIGAEGTVEYTVFDKPVSSIDFTGATTRLEYNTQMQPIGLLNSDGNRWSYTYDLDGMLAGELDYNGIATSKTLSPDGLTTTITTPAGTTTCLRYADGRTHSITDEAGVTSFFYDEFERLAKITGPFASIDYTRDAFGRAIGESVTLPSGETTHHYVEVDHIGRTISENVSLPLGDTISSHYMRNSVGEIVSSQHSRLASGSELRETIAEVDYGVDTRGIRNQIRTGSLIQNISVDNRGRTTADSLLALDSSAADGMKTVSSRMFEWRADGALKSITDYLRGVTTFDLDLAGRVTRLTRDSLSTGDTATDGTSRIATEAPTEEIYGFSAAGVLNFIDSGDHLRSPAGTVDNRSAQNRSANPVAAASTDARVEFEGTMPTRVGRTTYSYDKAGRVTQTVTKRVGKKPLVHKFYYAADERPIGFTTSDEPEIGYRYLYDPHGRRVAKERVHVQTGELLMRTVYTYAGNQLRAEQVTYSADDTISTNGPAVSIDQPSYSSRSKERGSGLAWTVDPMTGRIFGQIELGSQRHTSSGTLRETAASFVFVVTDLAGSPRELVEPDDARIVGRAEQTLYGKRAWFGTKSSPLLYAGQYLDEESGWAYNKHRYYDPHAGIYNAQDPLGVTPRFASAQGYVDHAAHWVDVLGLKAHEVTVDDLRAAGVDPQYINETYKFLNQGAGKSGKEKYLYSYPHLDADGNVTDQMQYVGQSVDPDRRAAEHGSKFGGATMEKADIDASKLNFGANGFTYNQARAFEQAIIDERGFDKTHNNFDVLHNNRNEIVESKRISKGALQGAMQWANWMMDRGAVTFAH